MLLLQSIKTSRDSWPIIYPKCCLALKTCKAEVTMYLPLSMLWYSSCIVLWAYSLNPRCISGCLLLSRKNEGVFNLAQLNVNNWWTSLLHFPIWNIYRNIEWEEDWKEFGDLIFLAPCRDILILNFVYWIVLFSNKNQ